MSLRSQPPEPGAALERSKVAQGPVTAGEQPSLTPRRHRLATAGWVVLAGVMGALAIGWVVQNELIHSSIQVGNSVPPIPALAALLLLGGAAALVRRRGAVRRARRGGQRAGAPAGRGRILAIYLFVTVAAAIPATASMSFLFAFITVPARGFPALARWLPSWFAVTDPAAVEGMFRGVPGGAVPWGAWALPLLGWGFFLCLLILTLYAALALLRPPWMEAERLTYPMVQIPLRLLEADPVRQGLPPLWRDPVMWIGFGLTAAFDGVNMLHTRWPAVPALGTQLDVGAFFPDRPWSALSPCVVSYRPEILGIGYLMPAEVLLTCALSYSLLRFSTVWRVAMGEVVPSTAYDYQEMGIGAFLALFGLILWRAQPSLRQSFREAVRAGVSVQAFRRSGVRAFGPARIEQEQEHEQEHEHEHDPNPRTPEHLNARTPVADEPLSARAAWGIVIFGTAAMLAWLSLAGLAVWLGPCICCSCWPWRWFTRGCGRRPARR